MNLLRSLVICAFVQAGAVLSQDVISPEKLELNELYEKAPHYGDWVSALKNLTPDKKARYIKFTRDEMLKNMREFDREASSSTLEKLMFLGDTEARDELVKHFYRTATVGGGANHINAFRAMGDPEIITMLAPALLIVEPFQRFGTDAFSYPVSFYAAEMMVAIAGNSSALNSDVINWARGFDPETPPGDPLREIMREWWHSNEQAFRDKNYAAVKPGRALPPLPNAVDPLPERAAPPAKPSVPAAHPAAAEGLPESSNNTLAYLMTGTAVLLLAAAFLFRRSRPSQ